MIKICIMCGKKFECYDKPSKSRHTSLGKRPFRSITCSKQCSRKYASSYERYKK